MAKLPPTQIQADSPITRYPKNRSCYLPDQVPTMTCPHPPLVVCYVPGFDRRRLSPEHTPFIHQSLETLPTVNFRTQPTTELVPTLITGVNPHQHKLWQVRLKPDQPRSLAQRVIDLLPDTLLTTAQCVRHRLDPAFDLPTIPPRRRRRFELHRNKYLRRQKTGKAAVESIGGVPSVFGVLGDDSRYEVITRFDRLQEAVTHKPLGDVALDFLELYVFDLFSHWNLDQPDAITQKMDLIDDALALLHRRCQDAGARLMLLVDHGQELVQDTIDLPAALKASGVSRDEFTWYSEVAVARFWFKTDAARHAITHALQQLPHTNVLSNQDLADFGIEFQDRDGFGELYAVTDHGHIFFPHDFHHPVVNWYMSHKHPEQAARRHNPVHRGYHGHLPDHPAERGYALVFDHTVTLAGPAQAQLIDAAPTMLALLGQPAPDHMRGRVLYHAARPATGIAA